MRLNFKTYGSGHPLINLHGLFGSLNNWHTLSKRFGEHFKVYAVDQRNHGRSPHSEVHNYQAMAEDLREFLQEHGISSSYLLGHSMGGKTAMEFAITYPEKTDRLIVVDISPGAYPGNHDEILEALSSLKLKAYSSRKQIDNALATKIPDRAVRQFLLTNLRREESGTYRWKMSLSVIRNNYREMNRAVGKRGVFEKPTLFIRGGNSNYIRTEDEALIKKLFPLSRIVTIKCTSHWVHADAPQEFFHTVLGFLNS